VLTTCLYPEPAVYSRKTFCLLDEINHDTIPLGIDRAEENIGQPTLIGGNEEQFSKRGGAVCFSRSKLCHVSWNMFRS
jgi:hypothetical protein